VLLSLLVVYSIGLVLLGWWVGRRVRHTNEFFVAGRALGAGLIFSTFLAANIGAGSTVGATGAAYREGLAAWWWNGSAGLGSLVLAFWIGPRMWREASARGFLTVGDFLHHRFGSQVRTIATTAVWLGSLLILTAQFNGGARVLEVASGMPPVLSVGISAVVMTCYFTIGGALSSVWVNVVQLVVIVVGFSIAAPLAVQHAGGLTEMLAANGDRMNFWEGPHGRGWSWLFLTGPAFFLSPGLIQKAFAAKDETALRRGVLGNGVALMVFAFAPVVMGLAARVLFPDIWTATGEEGVAQTEQSLPLLLRDAVPFSVGAFALAAVFSAEVSSADAVLFMLSTSGARDVYRGVLRPEATDAQVLRAARLIAVAGGVISYALTFVLPTVLGALTMFYSIMVVTLFAPILGGLLMPRSGRPAALSAIAAGLVTLFGMPVVTAGVHLGWGLGWVTPTLMGLAASSAVFFLVAALRRASGPART
jgi:SSS family solute:Na+ symporter